MTKTIDAVSVSEDKVDDLLARLYRDIGISAVAAALEVHSKLERKVEPATPSSGILHELKDEDLAA
jgi:hypothetical protein